mmetsp:Transcript_29861/g.91650  ORF Transcript_29861/g.91650 Transcript_29861/m.91650 type:complete len:205 (+) Transcript_29861:2844-3458(+)
MPSLLVLVLAPTERSSVSSPSGAIMLSPGRLGSPSAGLMPRLFERKPNGISLSSRLRGGSPPPLRSMARSVSGQDAARLSATPRRIAIDQTSERHVELPPDFSSWLMPSSPPISSAVDAELPSQLAVAEVPLASCEARRSAAVFAAAAAGVSGSPGVEKRPRAREILRSRWRLFWNHTCTCRGKTLSWRARSFRVSRPGKGSIA